MILVVKQKQREIDYNQEINTADQAIKWSWACRILEDNSSFGIDTNVPENTNPVVGDLALFKVARIGKHNSIITSRNKRMRIYVGDLLVGVFGNRYATDAYEGQLQGLKRLSILTAAGMVGTVKSRHHSIGRSTRVSFAGFLKDKTGQVINLKQLKFHKSKPIENHLENQIIIVGSGMNSGKTTVCRRLIKSLAESGFKVAACKLTGSVSNRDQDEMVSASAAYTTDFSDYGFPSTYKCDKDELLDLYGQMLLDIEKVKPDVTLIEIADGILQRETSMLLSDSLIQKSTKGVIITADSAPAALFAVEYLQKMRYNVIAVSGAMTSSPLYMREFENHCNIPIVSSAGKGEHMANILMNL
jgi:GTP-binding protein EngB required for normal cell division